MAWPRFLNRWIAARRPVHTPPANPFNPSKTGMSRLEQDVCAALRTVQDPELGMNIVDLGLVYAVEATLDRVSADITLTTPTCPLAETVAEDARAALRRAAPEVPEHQVRLVWDPPWKPSMMSDDARRQLGW